MKDRRIDVHHHMTPDFYVRALESIGITESYGQPFPAWTPKTSLSFMDKVGVQTAMLSISTPGVSLHDEAFAVRLARECNEYLAEVKTSHPGRFGGFAALPGDYPDASVAEAIHALDTLKLDGIGLLSHYGGRYLGDECYDTLFEELHRRKAVVFIHPTDPTGTYDPQLGMANALIEAPFETTRAATNLLYTGAAERFSEITFILAHGGGAIPYLAWRIATIYYGKKDQRTPVLHALYDFLVKGGPQAGLRILGQMYYDTALTSGPAALNALREFAGISHMVFGSDFPFAKLAPVVAKNLRRDTDFPEHEYQQINQLNCEKLFPAL